MVRSRLDVWQLLLRAGVTTAWLVIVAAAPTMAQEGQPPQPPQQPEDKPQSSAESFFRRTEVSGFVDLLFLQFQQAIACATVGAGREQPLCNFKVAYDSFSLNLAEIAFEETDRGQPRRVPDRP